MKINLTNISGFITKRVRLGNRFFTLNFIFNPRDSFWYFDCPELPVVGQRVLQDRPLIDNEFGQLIPKESVIKSEFKTLEWITK